MDLIKNTPGSRIEQVRGLIEPVYRYHLARCENYLEAQNFTTSTFLNAVSGIDTHTPGNQQELAIWIMRIARTQQAAGRRQPAFRHAHQENPDSPQPSATPGRSDVDGAASFFEENDQPSQDEILLRDQMVHLSRSWKEFPRQKADALALHFFCGLSLADIAKILKKK
jgi:DNA-directed RNA polymerase specialized sigma24 family protein